jgi:DMSO reductase anchor subunit
MLGLCTGAVLLNTLAVAVGSPSPSVAAVASVLTLIAWGLKLAYWKTVDPSALPVDPGSAIGIPRARRVSLFAAPGTGSNFVVNEMAFRVARKHAARLRVIALIFGAALPAGLALGAFLQGGPAIVATTAAAICALTGAFIERWLFFAEARHIVTLYFGDENAGQGYTPPALDTR